MNQVRILSMALVIGLGAMGTWVYKAKQNQWTAEQALAQRDKDFATELAMKQKEVDDQLSQKDLELSTRLAEQNVEFSKRIETLKMEEKKRLELAMNQFSNLLEGNKDVGSLINKLEAKVKSGQKISENEAEQLQTLVTAFTYLQKQYQRPLREFSELQSFLSRESDVDLTTPNMKNSFWKRVFSTKFRAQEREFYRSEGERKAYQEASAAFESAYGRAQKQMAGLEKELAKVTSRLSEALSSREKPEDLTPIIQQIRKGLEIHQNVIEFEPELSKELNDGVRP